MTDTPLISIILPVYNGELTLKATIESLICQTYQNFELIVGIDGSTDGSRAIAESFQDKRITIIEHTKNLGLANNLNTLLKTLSPKSEFFAMAEQDDLYEPQRLEWQVEIMQQFPKVGLVSGIVKFKGIKNDILFPGLLVRGEQFPQGKNLFCFLYVNQLKVVNTCMMVRNKVHNMHHLRFNNFYGNFNVDWDYVLRFSLVSEVYGIPKLLATMNRGLTNTSVTRDKKGQHRASRQLLKNFKKEFPDLIGSKEYRKALIQHLKVELGHHSKFKIFLLSIIYFLRFRDIYFIDYLKTKVLNKLNTP